MEESSSLRGPELTFAHKESSLWRAAQTDTEPEASLHSALLNKQRVCVSQTSGEEVKSRQLYTSPQISQNTPFISGPPTKLQHSFSLSQRNHTDDIDVYLVVVKLALKEGKLFLTDVSLLQNWPIICQDRCLKPKYIYYLESQQKR